MNIVRFQRQWLRNLFGMQNIFYLQVTFEQKAIGIHESISHLLVVFWEIDSDFKAAACQKLF